MKQKHYDFYIVYKNKRANLYITSSCSGVFSTNYHIVVLRHNDRSFQSEAKPDPTCRPNIHRKKKLIYRRVKNVAYASFLYFRRKRKVWLLLSPFWKTSEPPETPRIFSQPYILVNFQEVVCDQRPVCRDT